MKYQITYKLYTPAGALRVAAYQIIGHDMLPYLLQEYWILSQNPAKDTLQILKIN